MTAALGAGLTKVLAPVLGDGVAVENLRELTGGASRTTWAFDAVTGTARRPLILRTGAPDDVHAGMELEAEAQRAAAVAGARSPTCWSPTIPLGPWVIRS
ncbi:phosphotransferase enzyme family protein [Mycolicibacterium farcinogenes]|nr:phosphotransferase enzyme family protein [Mycolicibacterium farcinogenes]